MFAELTHWADIVVRRRFTVIGVMVAGLLTLGWYGLGLGGQLSSSGWDDPASESVRAAQLRDKVFGQDHSGDVILLFHAPDGTTIDDPAFAAPIVASLNSLPQRFPDQIDRVNGAYWPTETGVTLPDIFGSADRKHAFASIAISGSDDTEQMRNFRTVADAFDVPGVEMEVAGGQPVAGALNDTMAHDQRRMELFAIPAVAVLLFFLFGGAVAAALPLIVGGLTVLAAWGLIRCLTTVTEVNSFVSPVVSMIGLGLAIDYGLFVLSRFREELAAGRDVDDAVRRAVTTAGRTVLFSAVIVAVAAGAILVFPQGFLKSFAYGAIITIALAALTSITLLPALLAVLGRRVDRLGVDWFRKVTAPNEEPDNMWGRVAGRVTKRPLVVAVVVCAGLLLLILPMRNLAFGAINEKFLPPEHPTRLAQQHFDELFPLRRIDPIDLVVITFDGGARDTVLAHANQAPGLAAPFPALMQRPSQPNVFITQTVLESSGDAGTTVDYLRSMPLPNGTTLLVGGQPAVEKDSIDALVDRMPYLIALVFLATTVLMALTLGSLVLPLQAAALNLLGLGSTLGILTWIFVDGHGADLLGFTPQPIMALVLVVIVSVIYGLSTDYEIFLLSRIVEARSAGASTTDAIRAGVARTGRIITAAALILLVVTGAFVLSDLVMMQYIAFGMVAALLIDATILRVLLVPATMRLLGEACWWTPTRMSKGKSLGDRGLE
ncbi:MMPL family transporter [Nocardia donostiensis]|uniref:RND transporter n=1 Tax=Nocardia donostiensis TaxID=1538463 RepID=A0A1W0B0X0_9NOCA|nr:MMPL family transporter [Nocardia donostiensis]ONM48462.1 RND transporter [Nocardia donostiensis]OQS16149.1 RND transporter [Nocardia donostiensis]OQS18609.1 RND transporter [Nocardia donostiensis]